MPGQSEWFEKDYYKVLGVAEKATDKEITRAYRKLAKQHHPDAHPGSEEKFKEISAAYNVLGDPAKRKQYDEVRRLGPMGGMFGGGAGAGRGRAGGAGGSGGGFNFRIDDVGNLNDLLGGMFGGGRRSRGGTGPQRGLDMEAELHLSFEDAISGVTATVNVVSDATCRTCTGSGAAPGTSPKVCATCHGRGVVDDNQGMFSLTMPCTTCRGTGRIIEQPCSVCHGTGVERRARAIKARIPPGVEDGSRIRLKGRGAAGRNGGPSGDLMVLVHVAAHPLFGRRGRNLTLNVPISFPEAALGADIAVPTLDGPVTVRVPPGTATGKTFRVRGRGVAAGKGTAGDLLVTVQVQVPTTLSGEERSAVEALKEAMSESPRSEMEV
ncbi:MAG: molecular chaperone DnaJ [Actinomycetota bacterium]|nr:molecular chaperone DnaJ [Actinomycetota bacterium]